MQAKPEKNITVKEAEKRMFALLGTHKIMALASSVNNHVMVRNVSCLFYDGKVWFKTDKNFRKTQQLYKNPNVALCWNGVQIEGTAAIKGLVAEEPGLKFAGLYETYLKNSYNKYSHEDTEIIVEVTPGFVELWDTDENGDAYQVFIDFEKGTTEVKSYD